MLSITKIYKRIKNVIIHAYADKQYIAHTIKPCSSCGHEHYQALDFDVVSCAKCGSLYSITLYKQDPVARVTMEHVL